MIAKHQETVLVKAAKKSYSTILNSINIWQSNNGSIGDYETYFNCTGNECVDRLAENLQVVSVCYNSLQMDKCGGAYQSASNFNKRRIVLKDGSFVNIDSEERDGTCVHPFWAYEKDENGNYIPDPSSPNGYKGEIKYSLNCGFIYFDTNGLKEPNQLGKDVFGIS